MKNLIWIVVIFGSLIGCKEPEQITSYDLECTCPNVSEHYVANLQFTDHTGKDRTFPYLIGHFSFKPLSEPPTGIWETKGISLDGNTWYYSIKPPHRLENGLIKIEQVDGPVVMIDYKDIEVTLKPCIQLPLDQSSEEILKEWENARKFREKDCPLHNYETGSPYSVGYTYARPR